eukprot:TRINITY_DN1261_c1_g1_i4.p1 TRINITY_DN1261_c1_g1~~TRINITY_DN1261_c1_g1_i4.p1  ORF type:complete len:489 (-),score=65.61 TRINITY_DN1261_c1_g1_i4:471-1937(-)
MMNQEKDKDKDKEKDKDKTSKTKKAPKSPTMTVSIPLVGKKGSGKVKNSTPKGSEKQWKIWFRLIVLDEDYDYIPLDIESNITIHELKQKILQDENLDLDGFKLYLVKLYKNNTPLDPRALVSDVLDDNDEVDIRIGTPVTIESRSLLTSPISSPVSSPRSPRSALSVITSSTAQIPSVPNDEVINKIFKREIGKLKKEMAKTKGDDSKQKFGSLENEVLTLAERLENIEIANSKRYDQINDLLSNALTPRQNQTGSRLPVQIAGGPFPGGPTAGFPAANEMARGLPTVKPKDTLEGHKGPIHALACTDELLFSGSGDTTINVWELSTLKIKQTFKGHTKQVSALAKSNDNKTLVSGSSDCTLRVWDIEHNGKCITFDTTKDVSAVCMSRNLVFSGHLKTVMLWDVKKKVQIKELSGHDHWVRAIHVVNGYCYTGARSIQVWDLGTFTLLQTIDLSSLKCGSIYCMGVYENMMLAGTYQQIVTLWDMR